MAEAVVALGGQGTGLDCQFPAIAVFCRFCCISTCGVSSVVGRERGLYPILISSWGFVFCFPSACGDGTDVHPPLVFTSCRSTNSIDCALFFL